MSILIKGMEMPKKCTVCNFGDALMGKGFCYVSHCKQIENYFVRNDRPSWCPLVELPPHGLIDKQMLLRNISENQFTNSYVGHEDEYAFWDKVWDYIINAPTIIESEGEE